MRSTMSCLILGGSSLFPRDTVDHGSNFAVPKPVECESTDVRSSYPWWLELRPMRNDQQHAKGSNPVHCSAKGFQARRVDPMRILEDHQHGVGARQRLHLRS